MRLKLLRSAWGLGEALTCRAPHTIEKLRAAGFHGLEASLSDIGSTPSDRRDFVRAARTGGLQLVLSAYSSWPNYEGPFDATRSVRGHADALEGELRQIAELHAAAPLLRVNAHSGSDAWSEAEAREYFERTVSAAHEYGDDLPPVSHETHRGRYLCCPFPHRGSFPATLLGARFGRVRDFPRPPCAYSMGVLGQPSEAQRWRHPLRVLLLRLPGWNALG